jgi:glyoxylase-like metal-dependent hydrolase (beta-lactamase superfamily II)
MIIDKTGHIAGPLYMLGNPVIPVFLLDGNQPAVIDAGFYTLGETYVKALRKILQERQPAYIFLTHSHFDHCGSVAVLKKHFPDMKVMASEKAQTTLAKPNAIRLIRQLTEASLKMGRDNGYIQNDKTGFEQFEVDMTVSDGDELEIDPDMTLQVMDTPGHTRDCLSYYVPQKRILFSSEATGILDATGYIVSDCLVDYDMYVRSLKKLGELDIDILCLGHRYVLTGEDARNYIPRSMKYCELFRETVDTFMHEEKGCIARVIPRIKHMEYDTKPEPRLPEPAYVINLEARIRAVMERKESFISS